MGYPATACFMSFTTVEGSQSLLGYQRKILPSGPMMAVEREWVRVLLAPGLTPTSKNWSTCSNSEEEGAGGERADG